MVAPISPVVRRSRPALPPPQPRRPWAISQEIHVRPIAGSFYDGFFPFLDGLIFPPRFRPLFLLGESFLMDLHRFSWSSEPIAPPSPPLNPPTISSEYYQPLQTWVLSLDRTLLTPPLYPTGLFVPFGVPDFQECVLVPPCKFLASVFSPLFLTLPPMLVLGKW